MTLMVYAFLFFPCMTPLWHLREQGLISWVHWGEGWCWNDQGVMVLEIPGLQCKLIDLPPLITNVICSLMLFAHMEHVCSWRNEVLWLQYSKFPRPDLSGDPLSALPWAAAAWEVGVSSSVRTKWRTQNHLGESLAEQGPMFVSVSATFSHCAPHFRRAVYLRHPCLRHCIPCWL